MRKANGGASPGPAVSRLSRPGSPKCQNVVYGYVYCKLLLYWCAGSQHEVNELIGFSSLPATTVRVGKEIVM